MHIFDKNSKTGVEIPFNEYVEEIDISANGKYIAAGTGGSVYFFETFDKDSAPIPCITVIEPKSEEEKMAASGINGNGEQVTSSLCGDGKCEGPETIDNCKQDCDSNYKGRGKGLPKNGQTPLLLALSEGKLPEMLFGFGFLGVIIALGGYFVVIRFNLLRRKPEKLTKLNKKIE